METQLIPFQANHCVVKSVQIRSYFWSVFSPNTGKYGPEITPYLDAFHSVNALNGNPVNTSENQKFSYVFRGYRNGALLWNRFTNSSLDSISQKRQRANPFDVILVLPRPLRGSNSAGIYLLKVNYRKIEKCAKYVQS